MHRYALAAAVGVIAFPAGAEAPSTGSCPARQGNLVTYCGMATPEDIEVLPDRSGVIVSDMGTRRGANGLEGGPGPLHMLDLKSGRVTQLDPLPGGNNDWGDPACPGALGPAMNAHGIHLSRRSDGKWQVLVVNHANRESVEFFELARGKAGWGLRWRGCAVTPAGSRLNDVAALPGGGFLVTHMGPRTADGSRGENLGWLWRWTRGQGFSEQPGSRVPRPNGIAIDRAGKFAFINSGVNGGEVWKLDLKAATIVGKVAVSKADNSAWSRDGRLLVTGITAEGSSGPCFVNPRTPCGAPFEVFAIDPATLHSERIFAHTGGPVGGGTVAVQFGNDMLVGSFSGDRILRVTDQFARGRKAVK